ncbi:apolipoprotein L2-like isoform X2 [Sorex fumeus]|uniref:apolipoprotein L2-like isoform X2 n=1 Tax=Sorex fumeus TaxID=62283 RepID=UPI0024AD6B02|nr:apolipoprotein L2-like isoform X2 [Sorex fumeus]
MNPEVYPANCSFVEYSINYIQNTMNKEDLYSLLTNNDIWEYFVTEAHFSSIWSETGPSGHIEREEADEVRVSLMAQEMLGDMKHIEPQEQEFRERFLKEFPQMKRKLEEQITQLRELADKADQIHKDCTISNMVASSSSILSGILTIAGMGLAPVTAGISLGLTTAGVGLGAASAVTGVATGIVEHVRLAAVEGDAKKLTSIEVNPEEILKGIISNCAPKVVPMGTNIYKGMMNIEKNIRAIKLVSANPRLAARATRFMNSGRISARGARQVKKAFGGTALAMSKGARLAGMATSGIFLLADVYSLVQQSADLQKGAQTASASRLREHASELEMKLENLKEIHAIILEDQGIA